MSSPFSSDVEVTFAFLERMHGFRLIERGRSTVVYTTATLQVSLFYDDQRSFEVSLGLSRQDQQSDPPFSFDELLRFLKVPFTEWPNGYSARTIDTARKIVEKMAVIISRYAGRLLEGDVDSWNRLEEQRRAECIAYAATTNMAQAKRIADAAWASHDYQKVVSALEAVEEELGKTDAAKLAYARRAVVL